MKNENKIIPGPQDALVIIDMQNDFCPGNPFELDSRAGALAVAGGREIEYGIVELAGCFSTVVMSQDWHPQGHSSFASSHPGASPFSTMAMSYGPQVLWPDHCIQGTKGADFTQVMYQEGVVAKADRIFRKGSNPAVDSYSAFLENDHRTSTGLGEWCQARGIKRIFLVGLAYDFCVGYTALDAVERMGLQAVIVKDLCRAIKQPLTEGPFPDTEAMMEDKFTKAGVKLMTSEAVGSRTKLQPGAGPG